MNTLLCLVALGVLVTLAEAKNCSVKVTGDIDNDFEAYIKCFYPNYKPDKKHRERLEKFKKCHEKFNNKTANGPTHEIGFTHFCFVPDDEVNSTMNNHLNPKVLPPGQLPFPKFDTRQTLPANFSWIDRNAVTPVKNQGSCGSCYTFAAVAALEGAYAIKTGKLVQFAEQQYVDCSYQYGVTTWTQNSCDRYGKCTVKQWDSWDVIPGGGNRGCSGGDYRSAWAYNNQSRQPENLGTCYPYTADKNNTVGSCKYNAACPTKAVIAGYVNVPNDVNSVMQALVYKGPLACALYASTIKYYKNGIVETPATAINHAITIIGYGIENSKPFWIIKNSWGPYWGELGYFRVLRQQIGDAIGALGLGGCSYPVLA